MQKQLRRQINLTWPTSMKTSSDNWARLPSSSNQFTIEKTSLKTILIFQYNRPSDPKSTWQEKCGHSLSLDKGDRELSGIIITTIIIIYHQYHHHNHRHHHHHHIITAISTISTIIITIMIRWAVSLCQARRRRSWVGSLQRWATSTDPPVSRCRRSSLFVFKFIFVFVLDIDVIVDGTWQWCW